MEISLDRIAYIATFTLTAAAAVNSRAGLKDWPARLVSWALALGAGALTGPDLPRGLAEGACAALVANGVFTIEQVRALLGALGLSKGARR